MAKQQWAGAIRSADDVKRVLADVNRQSLTRANTTALAAVARPADDVEIRPDATRLLPLDERLAPLLSWPGLPRGSTVAVVGSLSMMMILLSGAMRDGAWSACVGIPGLGVLAAVQDHGIPADRFALVPNPGPDWPQVVAALIDGVDVVAVGVSGPAAEGIVRSLQARARQRGTVLVPVSPWPLADVTLEANRPPLGGTAPGCRPAAAPAPRGDRDRPRAGGPGQNGDRDGRRTGGRRYPAAGTAAARAVPAKYAQGCDTGTGADDDGRR